MKLKVLLLCVFTLLSGCRFSEEVDAATSNVSEERVWVFAQFNVPEENDGMETYYYYGNVAKSLYEQVSNNRLSSGFVLMKQVRYWGDDDRVHDYKDAEDSGNLIFRIEDIRRIKLINQDPLLDPENKEQVAEFQQ
ncbi:MULTISPECIES: hypothetical protein [Motilimonas]|uniref:Lipoprotein n=1 Tax=Motilimonas cestriensis TaxID=2742685 RepID=A0ABS8W9V8_9GAMM|nr:MULTISPECIES: hypothetical protein [Motilimonas]MCE0557475.1 hypothetical protein [Motilimonas sp. E26]MCE2594371.1 hypothetical protein [Motilimonas cestriensis]MDO6525762.1 hypothetical protein [Motilimonas sp. 1_MG-2023]